MGFVDYEEDGYVGIMTINRPQALNALNKDVLKDIEAAFDAVDLSRIRTIILTGAGEKSFVAGADIAAMSTMTKAEGEAFGKFGNDIFRKIETFPIPVIAAVNGFALGGGNELAMSCDIRICSDNAMFGQPEVGLGIFPGFGGTQRMPRLIGDALAKELIFTTRQVNGQEAKEIGLVNRVVEPEELMNTALEMANVIAGKAPIAVGLAKDAINRGRQVDIDDAMSIEAANDCIAFSTEDQKEGMYAFVEKRPPVFKNR